MVARRLFICFLSLSLIQTVEAFAQDKHFQSVTIFFGNQKEDPEQIDCGKGYPVVRKIPKNQPMKNKIKAVLAEVLRGPTDKEREAGFFSSVPTPAQIQLWKSQILEYLKEHPVPNPLIKLHEADTIVTVRKVVIVRDSVYVRFSNAMRAYGGGSCRVGGILGPIRETLFEFKAIRKVGFGIEGVGPDESFQP